MITLLIGKKGSGKTKKLIEMVQEAAEKSNGNVVVIEKSLKLTYDIPHTARLVACESYGIVNVDALFGFVSGICAGNYDVTDIFIDSTLKIAGVAADGIEALVSGLKKLGETASTNITLSVSAAEDEIPASVKEYVLK